ncbi:MAG TPA: (2Fe-2S) ferredoxin domain-containing protein [Holophaga sp.]|jgi:NADH:ubiquinone oxidoreductase subunit E|nr:(2Fe-2S) ferredoxin domain-containing protein [Holophaga sp.]
MCSHAPRAGTSDGRIPVVICMGSSCFTRGNNDFLPVIQQYLEDHQLQDKVLLKGSRCDGKCAHGPNLRIGDVVVQGVQEQDLAHILKRYL